MISTRGWTVRARRPGDRLRQSGGTKAVKALMGKASGTDIEKLLKEYKLI